MWEKIGLTIRPRKIGRWCATHASTPCAIKVSNDLIRIYFSVRDHQGRSRVTYAEVSYPDFRLTYIHKRPVLDLGEPGTFDDCGQMPSSVLKVGNQTFLYFVGWSVKNTVPFDNHAGLAVSQNHGSFKKSPAPVIPKTQTEPLFNGTIEVLDDHGLFRGYYMCGLNWRKIQGRMEPFYDLRYAESRNGVDWQRSGRVAIGLDGEEAGVCKASVLKLKKYHMWYSFRGCKSYREGKKGSYRIGYADSQDGISWSRKDELLGLGVSADGWDCQMTAYPSVVDMGEALVLFYSGNGFGATGIGVATVGKSEIET